MEQISQFYQQSQFSLAAYANFSIGSENDAFEKGDRFIYWIYFLN